MADEFRDAIRSAVSTSDDNTLSSRKLDDVTDAILAMPEMQAIKQTLFDLTHPSKWTTADGPRALHVENLRTYDLPESIVEWVLS